MKYIVCLYCFIITGLLKAQPAGRFIQKINTGWQFVKDKPGFNPDDRSTKWEQVTIPHSWNKDDVMDDEPGYYRGVGWYRKKILIDKALQGKTLFLFFEGANQVAEVFINGKKAGSHIGGYTGFNIPITDLITIGKENELLVKVDNSFNSNIPPLTADFTFYGGIYRDVYLEAVDPVHFLIQETGGNGVSIQTPVVNENEAEVAAWMWYINTLDSVQNISLRVYVKDQQHKIVLAKIIQTEMAALGEEACSGKMGTIEHPHLWSPEDPYLYTVTAEIRDSTGKILDVVEQSLGLRWFSFDADKGFSLNGKPYKLIGASRHQDRPGMANAVPDELAIQDISLLKKMGANFLRVAHYPQDPSVLKACDSLGVLASVEIPIVNEISETDSFYTNCENMLLEMIDQNYNHPWVIIWCYMNEVLLRPHFTDDKERQKIYFSNIVKLAKRLDSITRKEDPSRYTMIANHGDFDRYYNNGLTAVPQVVGWNIYSGWYGGQLKDFSAFLDKHHQLLRSKPLLVTEYGADADPRIRSFTPVKFDKSVEYAIKFHQYYLQEIMKRPFVSGSMIWNLADFNSETREETMPHINNKGMLMWDRTPKDLYYYYQAMLVKDPFIKIASSYWNLRSGIADSLDKVCYQPLQVASNLDSLELIVNGRSHGWKQPIQGLCEWNIPFIGHKNFIEAKGRKAGQLFTDKTVIDFQLQPYQLDATFKQVNLLLGAERYYIDEKKKEIWLPDQSYRKGSWGYTGGQPFKLTGNTRLPYGSDKNIQGTNNDPVYQTQRTGINSYKFDVVPGNYELTLHFAELQGIMSKALVYNLSATEQKEKITERVFSVYVNGKLFLENFNIAAQYGMVKPVIKKLQLVVKAKEGVEIVFKPVEGEPVLNAIQLKKIL